MDEGAIDSGVLRSRDIAIPEFRMTLFFKLFQRPNREQTANGLSLSVAAFAILFLHFESSPTPAGADVARRPSNKPSVVIAAAKPDSVAVRPKKDSPELEMSPEDRAHQDLIAKIRLLEAGMDYLAKTPDYTAQFVKQELINGELLDEQEMEMKVRHAPFSVYLKWNTGEVGREVLYVDGANGGRMTAHGGGWKARLPAVSLEPTSSLAMAESRHPINKAGLYQLSKMMLDVHKSDLQTKRIARCEKLADQTFDGRVCHVFLVEYKDPQLSEQYRKSISMIDKEWSIPIYVRNFGWLKSNVPEDPEEHDAASLVEFYSYSNVRFGTNLAALDFDHTNEEYRFKRQ